MNVNWWGKIFGSTFGFMFGGPLGGMLGAALGHSLDRGFGLWGFGDGFFGLDTPERVHPVFFTTTFQVMGCVAAVDGSPNRRETAAVRNLMAQMRLTTREQEQQALALFYEGVQPDFDLDVALAHFRCEFRGRYKIIQLFVEIQLAVAYADGRLNVTARELLLLICERLDFPRLHFDLLEDTFHARHGRRGAFRSSIAGAYAILGLEAGATDIEIKSAYRRLLNRHHPDKLIARQASEEALKMATKQTLQIMAAYERIRAARGF